MIVQLTAIILDDSPWDPKPAYNIFPYKILYLCFYDCYQCFYLHPLHEVVDYDE